MSGKLFIVGTPIGNLGDITLRALETLKSVDMIACENRDRHLKLLNHFEIKKKLLEYSPANEVNSAKGIVKLLLEGKNIALVSDAGMPGISDPGMILVDSAYQNEIEVVVIPGVSALSALISMSGYRADAVLFLGFLSKKEGKIKKELRLYTDFEGIIVIYVSQYQIKKLLEMINIIYGNVEIIIGREITKVNEEWIKGKVLEIIEKGFEEKGEFSLGIIKNNSKKLQNDL